MRQQKQRNTLYSLSCMTELEPPWWNQSVGCSFFNFEPLLQYIKCNPFKSYILSAPDLESIPCRKMVEQTHLTSRAWILTLCLTDKADSWSIVARLNQSLPTPC